MAYASGHILTDMCLHRVLVILSIAVGAILLTACGGSDQEAAPSTAPTSATEPTETPTEEPEPEPTEAPTKEPEPEPTEAPTKEPEPEPTEAPTEESGLACPVDAAPGTTSTSIESGGNTYDYTLQIPKSYDGEPQSLVLNFHGLGSQASEQAALSGYPTLADSEGFVVAHPTGQPNPDGNNSWELSFGDDPDRDDAQFVRDLIDEIAASVCIDTRRVYATGMSNGGFFSADIVCLLGDRIAAAASVAGVSYSPACDPLRPMSFIGFHGTADTTVPYDGGGESSLGSSVFFDQVMPDEFAEFAADFGCNPDPVTNGISDAVTRFDYVDCADDVELSFYELVDHGHNWPGSPVGKAIEAMLGANNMDVSATELSWEFFQRHQLPADFE